MKTIWEEYKVPQNSIQPDLVTNNNFSLTQIFFSFTGNCESLIEKDVVHFWLAFLSKRGVEKGRRPLIKVFGGKKYKI